MLLISTIYSAGLALAYQISNSWVKVNILSHLVCHNLVQDFLSEIDRIIRYMDRYHFKCHESQAKDYDSCLHNAVGENVMAKVHLLLPRSGRL